MKYFTIILMLFTFTQARENPFFPTQGEKDITYTSNKNTKIPSLKKASIILPDQARTIHSFSVQYKNLDGSMGTKTIELENAIDWHLPIFISQNYNSDSITTKQKNKKHTFQEIARIKYAQFLASEKTLKIITTDKLIRNFLLVNPHRVVLDFQRTSNMKSYTKINKNLIFSKIKVGNHADYYRVVIELDGHYKYTTKESSNEIIIELQ